MLRPRRLLNIVDPSAQVAHIAVLALGDIGENLTVRGEHLTVRVQRRAETFLVLLDAAHSVLNAPAVVGGHLVMDFGQRGLQRVQPLVDLPRNSLQRS